jgi:hypothetical protein
VQPLHFRVPGFSHTRQERLGGCACDCACGWGPGSSVVSGFGDGGGSGTNGSGVGGGTSSSGADQAAPMTMKERKGEKVRDKLHPRQGPGSSKTLRSRRHDRRPSAYGTCAETCQFFLSHRRLGRDAACAYLACATSCLSRKYTEQQPGKYAKECIFACPCRALRTGMWSNGLPHDLAPFHRTSRRTSRLTSRSSFASVRYAQGRCHTHGFAAQQSASPLRPRPSRIPAADRLRSG